MRRRRLDCIAHDIESVVCDRIIRPVDCPLRYQVGDDITITPGQIHHAQALGDPAWIEVLCDPAWRADDHFVVG